ncbi:MAG TPA: tripartite tricarboxylate transporter substrate-binding protein [candidate division Zixibacteria bacterium]|nr:tripartite tricarboxylate transporter substrate-binding protein [candidate division Zixibacteria bacterium]
MRRRVLQLWALIGLSLAGHAFAQEPFYKGKTVRIIVGFSAGGGYDTYSRVLARHMGRHIPGNPAIAVENMPGAASLIAANHAYKVARPDGLTIGHFIGGLFLQALLGKPGIEFDARKFEYLGAPAQDNQMLAVSKRSGVTGVEQWMESKQVVKFGGVGAGSATDDITKIAKATLNLPIQLVSGYKGTADIRLAFNAGEVDGLTNSWESFKATWRREVESGEVRMILQAVARPNPEVGKVRRVVDYAKSELDRKVIQVGIHDYNPTARPYVLPPGTPKERVQLLRRAFMETMKDPEFLADAQKSKLDLSPLSGEELEKSVLGIVNAEPAVVARLKEILLK